MKEFTNKKRNGLFLGFAVVLIAAIFTLAGCDTDGGPEDEKDDPAAVAAEMTRLSAGLWNKKVGEVRWSFKISDPETGAGWLSRIGTYSQEPVTFKVENKCTKLRIVFDDDTIQDEVYAYSWADDGYLNLTIDGTVYPFEVRTGGAD